MKWLQSLESTSVAQDIKGVFDAVLVGHVATTTSAPAWEQAVSLIEQSTLGILGALAPTHPILGMVYLALNAFRKAMSTTAQLQAQVPTPPTK